MFNGFCAIFRSLEEREKLSERVAFLELRLQEKDEEMKVSARRTQLEAKNLKSQLLAEQGKLKDIVHKLNTNEVAVRVFSMELHLL